MKDPTEKQTLSTQELARLLGVEAETVTLLLQDGDVPPPIINRPRLRLWSRRIIDRWMETGKKNAVK